VKGHGAKGQRGKGCPSHIRGLVVDDRQGCNRRNGEWVEFEGQEWIEE